MEKNVDASDAQYRMRHFVERTNETSASSNLNSLLHMRKARFCFSTTWLL